MARAKKIKAKVILHEKATICYAIFKENWEDTRWVKTAKYRIFIDWSDLEWLSINVIEVDRSHAMCNDHRGATKRATYNDLEDLQLDWEIVEYVTVNRIPGLLLTREYPLEALIDKLQNEIK